jgi:hypothetical protein
MTPSGWGDDAQVRDRGHDEMQARFYREWLGLIKKKTITRPVFGTDREFVCVAAHVEVPFTESSRHGTGRLLGFADVAVTFGHEDTRGVKPSYTWWRFYCEIKPVIYSVGAIIRQCKATEILAKRGGIEWFDVYAIVYEDDPKAALLEELYPQTVRISREATP